MNISRGGPRSEPGGSRDRYRRCSSSEAITWAESPHRGAGGGVYEGEGIGKVGRGCGRGRERKGIFRRERFVIVGEVWDSYLCF